MQCCYCNTWAKAFCLLWQIKLELELNSQTHKPVLKVPPVPPLPSSRRWNASWLWSVNVTASAARAASAPAGWPWLTSDAPATTCVNVTTVLCRWLSTSTALGSPPRTLISNDQARTIWCTLKTRQTTAYETTSQVQSALSQPFLIHRTGWDGAQCCFGWALRKKSSVDVWVQSHLELVFFGLNYGWKENVALLCLACAKQML